MPPNLSHASTDTDRLLNEQERSSFGVSLKQLTDLFQDRVFQDLKDLGGLKGVARKLRVEPKTGLDSSIHEQGVEEGEERADTFGRNTLPPRPSKSFLSLLKEAMGDNILQLLSVAAVISLAMGIYEDHSDQHPEDEPRVGWVEGAAILIAVSVVVFTNAINDYQKERQFRKLSAKRDDRSVRVIRGGQEQEISVWHLLVGDILIMEPGDILPVDALYLHGDSITCDESSATGESDLVRKTPDTDDAADADQAKGKKKLDPFLLSGSKVTEGMGRALVVSVGIHSLHGQTMMALRSGEAAAPSKKDDDNESTSSSVDSSGSQETPLQGKLNILAEYIAKLGIVASLAMFLILSIKFLILASIHSPPFPSPGEILAAEMQFLLQAITILVVAVPEGLPMAVTLALAYATTQMLQDNNLVRVLSACETMGSATVVCTDKTGTLTQNRMTVVKATMIEKHFWHHAFPSASDTSDTVDFYRLLEESVTVNSTAFESDNGEGQVEFIGSKTECALLGMLKSMGSDYRKVREGVETLRAFPFSSAKKSMSVIVRSSSQGGAVRVHTKGASEMVMLSCSRYVDKEGKVRNLDKKTREAISSTISRYAGQALRTICVAYKDLSDKEVKKATTKAESDDGSSSSNAPGPPSSDLILLGLFGIQDPLREGVPDAVKLCRRAGVYVKMITGDNVETAKAIAIRAGIHTRGGLCMTGHEFRNLEAKERTRILPRLQVLARSSPLDKQIVVKGLQGLGEVVAMTGDGTNDAPALKMANVGFSMGIAGTEVAKEAADIILMDDNFTSIVAACRWGRQVNDSVRKFLQFQLTVNICAVVLAFVSALTDPESRSVLSATQLLWVNLIMDTLAALALSTDPPDDGLLHRMPLAKNASLISFPMWKSILGQAIFQLIATVTLLHFGPRIFHLDPKTSPADDLLLRTLIFNSFVMLQVFNQINCRKVDDSYNVMHGIFRNRLFLGIQLFVIAGQYLIVTYGGVAFKTTPLPTYLWAVSFFIGFLSLPIGFILRLLPSPPNLDADQHHTPLVSETRLQWEGAIRDVTSQLRVYSALRRIPGGSDDGAGSATDDEGHGRRQRSSSLIKSIFHRRDDSH
ncbi:PMCA-type calcium-translocating P-type ATPase [Piptocephalis cylindrospora]|uniref:Calcium-transporting ATPase n=1 Tax=Piptocephalis cylindrospora TaxID=1907219 RepID=A0A4P9Y928_9FUNG|nr:PMCA-type calcium-translocating P-type ATPase [Piptocephalis cylindrospora]|eukprot:RKP14500.1 PMCA-type calcium-translocating P-type ATPase [Piptocephalis cylindrospora]